MTQPKVFQANDPPVVPTATLLSETTLDGITRSLTVSAAYDFRAHPRNYGIHHTEFRWLVQYRNIGVELRASPRWFLPQNRSGGTDDGSPRLAELTIHSPEPLYAGHEPHSDCSITGGDCYCSSTFAAGARLAEILIADPAGFWPAMEQELSETQTRMLPMTGRRSKIMTEKLTTEQVEEIRDGAYIGNFTSAATVCALATELLALRKRVGELEGDVREIELNVKAKLRLAFRKALADLPEIAPPEIRSVLSSVHMQDEFLREGKRLQIAHGLDSVAPRVEQECGAGAWSFMRQGVLAALPTPESK